MREYIQEQFTLPWPEAEIKHLLLDTYSILITATMILKYLKVLGTDQTEQMLASKQ